MVEDVDMAVVGHLQTMNMRSNKIQIYQEYKEEEEEGCNSNGNTQRYEKSQIQCYYCKKI